MFDVPDRRIPVGRQGRWICLKDMHGVTHFAWQWDGGSMLGYLCCSEPELYQIYLMPTPTLDVTCLACLGTIV